MPHIWKKHDYYDKNNTLNDVKYPLGDGKFDQKLYYIILLYNSHF